MKEQIDVASIISFYDSSAPDSTTYSKIFDNSVSANLNTISKPDKAKTFKYNTWEITGEHDGIFEKKKKNSFKGFNGMSYFSKSFDEDKLSRSASTAKPNMFKEAIKRNSDIITNVNKQGEEMRFKRFEQYISMEVRGVKKIYDIFEVFNGAKTVNLEPPKQSAFQKVSSLFFSRKKK